MKDRFKKLVDRLKTFVEAGKIWLFFIALFGTNAMQAGVQEYVRSEPEPVIKPVAVKPVEKPQKATIIYKTDIELVKKLIAEELNDHKTGAQH